MSRQRDVVDEYMVVRGRFMDHYREKALSYRAWPKFIDWSRIDWSRYAVRPGVFLPSEPHVVSEGRACKHGRS
jgi:hypothetical protein